MLMLVMISQYHVNGSGGGLMTASIYEREGGNTRRLVVYMVTLEYADEVD